MTGHLHDRTPDGKCRVERPVAEVNTAVDAQVREPISADRSMTTPRSSSSAGGGSGQGRRVDRRRVAGIRNELSDSHQAVLEWLLAHRYATTHQLRAACFTETGRSNVAAARATTRALRRLEEAGLIRPLHRRVGGLQAGSAVGIYQLTPGGYRVAGGTAGRFRSHEPSPRLLAHWLAIGDVHVALRGIEDDVEVQVEPASWRRYTGLGGEPKWLQPDLAVVLHGRDSEGAYESRWFIEVDLGTEGFGRLECKALGYETYLQTVIEQDRHGVFPLVLWLFAGETNRDGRRQARFASLVERSSRLTTPLHRTATPDDLLDALRGGLA